jgi:hypothetical protein
MADGLEAAQREYYNARYGSAARVTADACAADANGLAACELRTAVLLFQIKAPLGPEDDKEKAWKNCAPCPDLLPAFNVALAHRRHGSDSETRRPLPSPSITQRCDVVRSHQRVPVSA